MRILITGTPGTGKTTFSLYFSNAYGYYYVNVNNLIQEYGLFLNYDSERNSHVVDIDNTRRTLRKVLKNVTNAVIDTHIVEVVPKNVDLVIVFRLNPLKLREVLKKRGYNEKKIAENVEAEFIGVCATDAHKRFHNKVFELDVTNKTFSDIEQFLFSAYEGKVKSDTIDWTELLQSNELEELLSYLSKNR